MGEPRQPLNTNRRRFTSRVRPEGAAPVEPFRRVAKLRLGEKKTNGAKEFPTEIDYFKLSVEEWVPIEIRKEIEESFLEFYGPRPTVIRNVFFISENDEDVLSQNYEMWGGGKLLCHGNGDVAQRRINEQRQIEAAWFEYRNCANVGCPDFLSGKCGPMNRLRFMLPKVTVAGYVQIDTGSWNSSDNLEAGLATIRVLTRQIFGQDQITGIPLVLSRAPKKIEHMGKLNTHFIVSLMLEASNFDQVRALAAANAPRPLAQLTAGVVMDIPADEDDQPSDNVAASDQMAHPDPLILTEIGSLFDTLNTNASNRAAKLHEYAGREIELRNRLKNIAACTEHFRLLQASRGEVNKLLQEYAHREGELLVELKKKLDETQPGHVHVEEEPEFEDVEVLS